MPVGSSQWVQNERDQATEFVHQDVEEFSYSVRNELDWLNEHMADIFSQTQVYVLSRMYAKLILTAVVILPTCSRRPESCAVKLLELLARSMRFHHDSLSRTYSRLMYSQQRLPLPNQLLFSRRSRSFRYLWTMRTCLHSTGRRDEGQALNASESHTHIPIQDIME